MPAAKLKMLYLGSNLSDLRPKFELNIKGKNTKMLCSTAQKLYEQAAKANLDGDQEQSYVDFMKYLEVVTYVQKSDEYAKDKTYYSSMLGPSNIRDALDQAERLQESLEKRYKLIQEKAEMDAALLEEERREAEQEERKRTAAQAKKIVRGQGEDLLAGVMGVSLSSARLFELLNQDVKMLILDARPAACFADSYMTLGNNISVPHEIVRAGISASALEKMLPEESKIQFRLRSTMTMVVLLDWNTTSSTLTPGSDLFILKNILQKWDPGVHYKYGPLILEGGYEDWLMKYPMMTSNPRAEMPQTDESLEDVGLDDIVYPPLYDFVPKPAVVAADTSSRPEVDRGSKAAAIQTYEERCQSEKDLLTAREEGAEWVLQLRRDLLAAEAEWTALRAKKLKEVEGETTAQMKNRMEQLVRDMARLQKSVERKEAENQRLREQAEYWKGVSPQDAATAAAYRTIADKDAEAKEMARKAQEAAEARLRKVAEDRKTRKMEEQKRKELQELSLERENGRSLASLEPPDLSSGQNMKRSLSSPNFAQADCTVVAEVPQFDRAAKPLNRPQQQALMIRRDFLGMFGKPPAPGLVGLQNLGNSCYMNSIIQCISNTKELSIYLVTGNYRQDMPPMQDDSNKEKVAVLEELAAVVRALWSGDYKYIACRDFKKAVGRLKDIFRYLQQQDAHEFLSYMINWLHEALNKRNPKSPLLPSGAMAGLSEAESWRDKQERNDSIIWALFYGLEKATVKCLRCSTESTTYTPLSYSSLAMPDHNNPCSIYDCLKDHYCHQVTCHGWHCPSCKNQQAAGMTQSIARLPRILVIHLKRFHHIGQSRKKTNIVDFPLADLDLHRFLASKNIPQYNTKYSLYGVSNHYGDTTEGGHYTAFCKNYVNNCWYKFDDNQVTAMDPGEVKTRAAYILFYTSANSSASTHR